VPTLKFIADMNISPLTVDLDFSELLAVHGFNSPSVINLRLEDASIDFVTQRIIDTVSQLEEELRQGIVVSVDDTSERYRNLPIK
jgi:predicted nuclease of predicted toxin-antitoxin system